MEQFFLADILFFKITNSHKNFNNFFPTDERNVLIQDPKLQCIMLKKGIVRGDVTIELPNLDKREALNLNVTFLLQNKAKIYQKKPNSEPMPTHMENL